MKLRLLALCLAAVLSLGALASCGTEEVADDTAPVVETEAETETETEAVTEAPEPAYPTVNEAKRRFAELSPLNLYFSTIEAGLSYSLEPQEAPDLAHYDATSTLKLGTKIA